MKWIMAICLLFAAIFMAGFLTFLVAEFFGPVAAWIVAVPLGLGLGCAGGMMAFKVTE